MVDEGETLVGFFEDECVVKLHDRARDEHSGCVGGGLGCAGPGSAAGGEIGLPELRLTALGFAPEEELADFLADALTAVVEIGEVFGGGGGGLLVDESFPDEGVYGGEDARAVAETDFEL